MKSLIFLLTLIFSLESFAQSKKLFLVNQRSFTQEQLEIYIDSLSKATGKSYSTRIATNFKQNDIDYTLLLLNTQNQEANVPVDLWKRNNKPVPSFKLKDINGNTVSDSSLLGTPYVIAFWFVKCQPCIKEFPTLNKIKEQFTGKEIHFIAITFDEKEKVIESLKANPLNFTHITNAKIFTDKLTSAYPSFMFVSKTGIVTHTQGGIPEDINTNGYFTKDFVAQIENLLKD